MTSFESSSAEALVAPVIPLNKAQLAFQPVGLEASTITEGPWALWQSDNRTTTTPHSLSWLERNGTVDNLRRLDGAADGAFGPRRGPLFSDSDVYKVLEAVAWDSASDCNRFRDEVISELGAVIAAAQQQDGYINSYVQSGGAERWVGLVGSHELYCIGHLIQAGIADHRATGLDDLFLLAVKAADNVVREFGDGKRDDADGHEEIEMALVELYRETGNLSYLDLAQQLIDARGYGVLEKSAIPDGFGHFDGNYFQDATPVRKEVTVVGHAVRAIYLLAGVVDLYIETGEQALLDSALRQWSSMTATKTYITGAVGSRFVGEAFGDEYELPPDLAYGETCATIGNIMLSWRLLLTTGEARFADAIERALYNLVSASTSILRTSFFYNNPAQRRSPLPAAPTDEFYTRSDAPGTRPAWFETACCPPNIMRTIASLSAYLATYTADAVQIHQFMPARLRFELEGGSVSLALETEYPLTGLVKATIEETAQLPWTLQFRKPEWADQVRCILNGQPVKTTLSESGYVGVHRSWKVGDSFEVDIPVQPRLTVAHPSVDAVRGQVAIERGPVVYAFESVDQAVNVDLNHVELRNRTPIAEEVVTDFLGRATVILRANAVARDDTGWAQSGWARYAAQPSTGMRPVELVAIPYALWANRGPSAMRIFVPMTPP